jgi:hypothetical protein
MSCCAAGLHRGGEKAGSAILMNKLVKRYTNQLCSCFIQ